MTVSGIIIQNIVIYISISIIGLIALVFISIIPTCIFQTTTSGSYDFNIVALEDSLTTTGSYKRNIYASKGYIDTDLSYFYLYNTDKGYKNGHIPADKTYIKYDDVSNPHITVNYTTTQCPDWSVLFFFDMNDHEAQTITDYIIVVPTGTITATNTYNIDLE